MERASRRQGAKWALDGWTYGFGGGGFVARRKIPGDIDPELMKAAATLAMLRKLKNMKVLTRRKRPDFIGTSTGGVIRTISGMVYR